MRGVDDNARRIARLEEQNALLRGQMDAQADAHNAFVAMVGGAVGAMARFIGAATDDPKLRASFYGMSDAFGLYAEGPPPEDVPEALHS
jgi:hypothetical protein